MKGHSAKPSQEDKLRLEGVAADVCNKTAQEIMAKMPIKTQEEEVTDLAVKLVHIVVDRYMRQRQISINPTTKVQAVQDIYKMLREELRLWSHEDLLLECSFILALTVVNELRSELI